LLGTTHEATNRCNQAPGDKSGYSNDPCRRGLLQEHSSLELRRSPARCGFAALCCGLREHVSALGAPSK
jgi:hypothetical protein